MVRVIDAHSRHEADLLRRWLESHDILCPPAGDHASPDPGENVPVWILDEERSADALALTIKWLNKPVEESDAAAPSWWSCYEFDEGMEERLG